MVSMRLIIMILSLFQPRYTPPVPPAQALLIISFGQSNCNGFYQTVTQLPGYLQGTQSNIQVWNYTLGTPAFQNYQVGVNNNIDNGAQLQFPYFGPDTNLCYLLAQHYGVPVYLMKYAQQATSMGYHWNSTNGALYPTLVSRANDAIAAIELATGKTVFPVLFSYQGESDGAVQAYADNYLTYLNNFHTAFAAAIGEANLHWVMCRIQLGLTNIFPYYFTVYNAQTTFCGNDPTYRHLISTNGQPTSDGVHLNGYGQVAIGQAAYDIIKLLYS